MMQERDDLVMGWGSELGSCRIDGNEERGETGELASLRVSGYMGMKRGGNGEFASLRVSGWMGMKREGRMGSLRKKREREYIEKGERGEKFF